MANNNYTAEQMQQWFSDNQDIVRRYMQSSDSVRNLRDIYKNKRQKSIQKVTKEQLRTWLSAPSNYEQNLKELSQYLFYRSMIYYKIVKYYANMIDLNARSVIPDYSFTDKIDKKKTLKMYNDTLQMLNVANLQYEFLKIYTTCWREDVFFGCAYWDNTGFIIIPLNSAYCRIDGVYPDSSFSYKFDCSFFRSYPELLEYWGEPFIGMYNEYIKTEKKWQQMPAKYSVCLKARAEDWELITPPLVGLFESLLNLLELEDVQAIANEEQIYKLLVATIPTISGSNNPDDFAVNPALAVDYFNKLCDSLPDYAQAVISPIPIEPIEFTRDAADDTTTVQKSTETILNAAGGAQVLNSAKISGTTAWTGAIKADTEFAISMLLPQTEAVINRLLGECVGNYCKVKFFEVSIYTKEELRKSMLENAQYGLPTKLAANALTGGFSEQDTMALNFLERDILKLQDKFDNPLQSSHTQSGKDTTNNSGRPTNKDKGEALTDDGEASQTKRDNAR